MKPKLFTDFSAVVVTLSPYSILVLKKTYQHLKM